MINEQTNSTDEPVSTKQPSQDKVSETILTITDDFNEIIFVGHRRKKKNKRMAKQKFQSRNGRWKNINWLISMYRS